MARYTPCSCSSSPATLGTHTHSMTSYTSALPCQKQCTMKQQGHAKRKEGGLKPTRRKEVENPQDDTATR